MKWCICNTLKEVSDNMFDDEKKFLCDFDEAKKNFCKRFKVESLTSCDAIYFCEDKFYFIEFKDLEKIKKEEGIKKFIEKNFEKKDQFLKKIDESKHILDQYLYETKNRKLRNKSRYIYYIIVTFPTLIKASEKIYLKIKMLANKPTIIKELEEKFSDEVNKLSQKIYFLEKCDYLKKNEFLEKKLYWLNNECKGDK